MKWLIREILAGLLLFAPLAALAAPGLPHQFYGTVVFNNGASPNGLLVEAKKGSLVVASATTQNGKYGYSPELLFVKDKNDGSSYDLSPGQQISFYVAGMNTGQTAAFQNGDYTQLNLAVAGSVGTITKEISDVITNEQAVITPTNSAVIKMGSSLNISISANSETTATIEKVEKLTSSFFTGSAAIIAGNNLLNAYEIKINGSGLNISAVMNYDDTGIDESTIKPYRFNGSAWVEIAGFTINTTANMVTFNLPAAATPYSLFGRPAVASVNNTGGSSGGGGGGGGGIFIPSTPASSLSAAAQKIDTNKDGKIDILDFNTLMVHWGESGNIGDFNGDSKIDIFDFNLLMVNWTG